MQAERGATVELAYRLLDESGEEVERAERDAPASFVLGAEELPPGVETALVGARAGDRLTLELEAPDAFGELDLEAIFAVPRKELPSDAQPRVGDWIPVHAEAEVDDELAQDELEAEDYELCVTEVRADTVFLSANHPLAGQRVSYDIEVVAVRAAT